MIEYYELMILRKIREEITNYTPWNETIHLRYIGIIIKHFFHSKTLEDIIIAYK